MAAVPLLQWETFGQTLRMVLAKDRRGRPSSVRPLLLLFSSCDSSVVSTGFISDGLLLRTLPTALSTGQIFNMSSAQGLSNAKSSSGFAGSSQRPHRPITLRQDHRHAIVNSGNGIVRARM